MATGGRWAGESSRCEDPAPTVGIAGRVLRCMRPRPSFTPMQGDHCVRIANHPVPVGGVRLSTGTAWRRITTRHAASLHPPRNGRIGFKPPYSKRESSQKPRTGSILYGEGFPPLAMKNVSIKHLQLFEDRSDAACRVVVKTTGSWGDAGWHGTRMEAAFGRDAERNALPANADCRGGVFAVFAKIPPPAASARRATFAAWRRGCPRPATFHQSQ